MDFIPTCIIEMFLWIPPPVKTNSSKKGATRILYSGDSMEVCAVLAALLGL